MSACVFFFFGFIGGGGGGGGEKFKSTRKVIASCVKL